MLEHIGTFVNLNWLCWVSCGRLGHIDIRLLSFLATSIRLLLFLPIERVLYSCQEYRVVLTNVFLIADSDLVTLIIYDGLENSIRIEVLFLPERH